MLKLLPLKISCGVVNLSKTIYVYLCLEIASSLPELVYCNQSQSMYNLGYMSKLFFQT